jgi:hypothetical protein
VRRYDEFYVAIHLVIFALHHLLEHLPLSPFALRCFVYGEKRHHRLIVRIHQVGRNDLQLKNVARDNHHVVYAQYYCRHLREDLLLLQQLYTTLMMVHVCNPSFRIVVALKRFETLNLRL